MIDPNRKPVRNVSPLAQVDRITAELSSDKANYDFMLSRLEEIAESVIADEGIALSTVCIQTLTEELEPPTERARKAMSAFISARLLRGWEAEAIEDSQDSAERFYHVAHNAIMACMAATLVSPLISDLEATSASITEGRRKGGLTTPYSVQREHELIKTALLIIWRQGARYRMAKAWARDVVKMHPELTHPNDDLKSFSKRVGDAGREVFEEDWLIWAHNGPTA